LARLIRERPVFVNVASCRRRGSSKRRNLLEYINISGVFQYEDGGRNQRTLAIRNLTGCGANRILKTRGEYRVSD
jgi:DNA primase catalytic subunit